MFVKVRMFFQWRLQMNIQALSGFGNGNPCASCCHERVRVASGCNVSRHISQHTSRQCILQRAYFDISSSISERKMLSDLLSGEKRGERRWGFFPDCTRWMDVSVVIWITVCFVSRLWPFYRECEARSNLAKSVFHLSLEQTGAGELTPIYHQCEIPAPLIWS